jgi:hypothetical protein
MHMDEQCSLTSSYHSNIDRLSHDDWERVQQATAAWYNLISNTCHKDHDCHFNVNIRFSYDGKYTIRIAHDGEIATPCEERHDSLITAMQQLLRRICAQALHECEPCENDDMEILTRRNQTRRTITALMPSLSRSTY